MDTQWVKLRDSPRLSWHVVSEAGTRCGRVLWHDLAIVSADLPMGEKSCESCARLVLHDAEKVAA